MPNPCIICVAITGSVVAKASNPAVPITIAEQIESTQEAFEAGASIAHCHVRDADGKPTSDPERCARLKAGIEAHCPGMIVQMSTGLRSGAGLEDNVRLAPANVALVQRAGDRCDKYERPVATWQQARDILGLRQVAAHPA
ncbi:3-keto-5-aminohexanoate cleavage protein [Roseovarius pelagicus]|uniref:3-keto-5-aminohexanoate cleavage protein n=1 Tax=Roseovarius pelagicus TaxID=2980108 RepID=A0ABY6D7Y4_9RHOB|nr:3-keto-5-aminohexanoate cleavage protein [Roseovarius pelagicus]UXX82208.1 3-keto-5-aminohexanoate cleavage protein [Roseovarius pelagicus]